MPVATARSRDDESQSDRRARILDAAERCFVRSGFHRTTMQDVAAEAAMSPGNLYRYFASKDAIVAGLAERDRAEVSRDFAGFINVENFAEGFELLARKHLQEEPRNRAILCLEIWAEATRNAAFAELTHEFRRELAGRMTQLFTEVQARGAIAAGVDPEALALLVITFADGLFVRRAIARDFQPSREIAQFLAVIEAAFAGRIDLGRALVDEPALEDAQ